MYSRVKRKISSMALLASSAVDQSLDSMCDIAPAAAVMELNQDASAAKATSKSAKRPRAASASAKDPEDDAATVKVTAGVTNEDPDEKAGEAGVGLIVAKAVRCQLKSNDVAVHCGSDALPALNTAVSEIINAAVKRALANGRKTLKACDI
jgi:hypothetical protein